MADGTHISWTNATWNVITGCSVLTPGCTNCYAMKLAGSRLQHHPSRAGLTQMTKAGPVWTGEVRFNEGWLHQPLRWKAPRDIFAVAHGDMFHADVPAVWLDKVWAVMILAHQHRLQVLTKRPERAVAYLSGGRILYDRVLHEARALRNKYPRLNDVPVSDPAAGACHRHIWIGTSVERQKEADERRPYLEAIAALGFNTWVSYEPALGPVDWTGWEFIRWMVSGGESGRGARPSHPDWHRATRDWCVANGIPYHFKQWGAWAPKPESYSDARASLPLQVWNDSGWTDNGGINGEWLARVGKKAGGALLDGREWREMPTVLFGDK